ncbi:MAG: quinate 5-dehydrogenase [Firmicutes bacterium]|nr:quinate 5-dehydrogenase [Bacillota bacterium]
MKWVMSVSLGDPARDHSAEVSAAGERVLVERRGTGGDIRRAQDIIRRYDGRVDAFGLGGVNLYYRAGASRYRIREGWVLREYARSSPVADGAFVKEYIEPSIVDELQRCGVRFHGRKALVASALDRWDLAAALERAGCEVGVCDAALALRLPFVFNGLRRFAVAARVTMPVLRHVPLRYLYPSRIQPGRRVETAGLRRGPDFSGADVLAGDSYMLWRAMPLDLRGKTVVLSTATQAEIDEALARGAAFVATTSPGIDGRSYGANVLEALISALDGRPPERIPRRQYLEMWERLGLRFRVERGEALAGCAGWPC